MVAVVRYHSSGIGTGHRRLGGVGVKVQQAVTMVTDKIQSMAGFPSNYPNRLGKRQTSLGESTNTSVITFIIILRGPLCKYLDCFLVLHVELVLTKSQRDKEQERSEL